MQVKKKNECNLLDFFKSTINDAKLSVMGLSMKSFLMKVNGIRKINYTSENTQIGIFCFFKCEITLHSDDLLTYKYLFRRLLKKKKDKDKRFKQPI